jgi:hypothetical protein
MYVFVMPMINIDLTSSTATELTAGPFCQACGGRTRLVGIEPHARLLRTDVRTYECDACQDVRAIVAPLPSASINAMVAVGTAA